MGGRDQDGEKNDKMSLSFFKGGDQHQKSKRPKFGLFDKRGGVRIFRLFPNLNVNPI